MDNGIGQPILTADNIKPNLNIFGDEKKQVNVT